MDFDKNYIETDYTIKELIDRFTKEFKQVRKENNLTQDLFSKYSKVAREKIARIESGTNSPSIKSIIEILGPIGYTIKIEKLPRKKELK